nr:alpha-ketoacid dehydrogenase subunit beta [Actinomycetota bacterium]
GGGLRFGAQHSQSIENWAMAVPGIKVVMPSTPRDLVGLFASSVRDDDPVVFLEQKALYATKGEVEDGEIVEPLGKAAIRRQGGDATIVTIGTMVPRALEAADRLQQVEGISCTVIDLRTLIPLDAACVLDTVSATGRLFTVEENPRVLGWGAEIASIVADEIFYDLDGPLVRIATPYIPLPAAGELEDKTIPSVDAIVETIRKRMG